MSMAMGGGLRLEDEAVCIYGSPPAELAEAPRRARQVSPLVPGSLDLADVAPGSLTGAIVAAPPGVIERRHGLALALRALAAGAPLCALAPKDKGGARLGTELAAFGCAVNETARRHHRICHTRRPDAPVGLDEAIAAGEPQVPPSLGLWTQPGVFSWDRLDPGSRLLGATLPPLAGRGADLGCGIGVLAQPVLAHAEVTRLDLLDIDRRAIVAARRNVVDARAVFHWCDVREPPPIDGLDFVVTNPPFHDAGAEDRGLGQAFIRSAHKMLRKGGAAWLVANRHLPYEALLQSLFAKVALKSETGGFKVYEARK